MYPSYCLFEVNYDHTYPAITQKQGNNSAEGMVLSIQPIAHLKLIDRLSVKQLCLKGIKSTIDLKVDNWANPGNQMAALMFSSNTYVSYYNEREKFRKLQTKRWVMLTFLWHLFNMSLRNDVGFTFVVILKW